MIKRILSRILFFPIFLMDYSWDMLRCLSYFSLKGTSAQNESGLISQYEMTKHKLEKSLCLKILPKLNPNKYQSRIIALTNKRKVQLRHTVTDLDNIYKSELIESDFIETYSPLIAHEEIHFKDVFLNRKSVRTFTNYIIPAEQLSQIIALAKQSPSVCNRQSWRTHVYQDKKIQELLKYQNGNYAWGNNIQNLLIITSDMSTFTTSSERNQMMTEGGIFAMSVMLIAESMGLSTCALNQSNYFWKDILIHKTAQIPYNEKIIMLLAIGKAQENTTVPKSTRYSNQSFLTLHYECQAPVNHTCCPAE